MARVRLPLPLDLWLIAALAVGLLAAAPLFTDPGLLNTRGGGDSPFLLFRLYELTDSLRAGVFPVRWMPDAAYGYGFPFFNFYAALPFYPAAGLRLAGFGLVGALKATHALGFLLAAGGMYAWARRVLGARPAAFVAAAAYTYAPFHLVNVYVRGDSLSEFYAFAWYPWILLALERVIERATPRRVAALALAYGALLTTHNVSMLIFTPFVALYAVAHLLARRTSWRAWGAALAGGALGVALAAWVWLPALGEAQYAQLEVQTTGYFNYAEHFRSPDPAAAAGQALVQPSIAFNYDTAAGPTPFAMGLVQAAFVAIGAVALLWRAARARHLPSALALVGLLVATFMITPWSRVLYERVPLLAFVQFPWRFLSVQAVFAAVAVAALVPSGVPRGNHGRTRKGAEGEASPVGRPPVEMGGVAALLISSGIAVALIVPQAAALPLDFLQVGDADVTAERLQQYELFTGNIGTTIRGEYLPQWVVPRPWTGGRLVYGEPDPAKVLAGEATATRAWARPDAQGWRVDAGAAGATVAFPTYYYPGWAARVDGAAAAVRPLDELGWITLDVPADAHDVALEFGRTPLRAGAEAAASIAAIAVGILLFAPSLLRGRGARRAPEPPASSDQQPDGRTPCAPTLLACGIFVLIASAFLQPSLPAMADDDLTWDFSTAPYLAHGGTRFGGGDWWLRSYTYSAEVVRAGEPLTVTLQWTDREGDQDNAYVQVSLVAPGREFPAREEVRCPHCVEAYAVQLAAMDGARVYVLQVPPGTPSGEYFISVQVSAGESDRRPALTASGLPRGLVYLRPVRVTAGLPQPAGVMQARMGPVTLAVDADYRDGLGDWFTLYWTAETVVPANYGLSLRLSDAAGTEWASRDTLAGNDGFLPSALWRPGEVVADRAGLLPPEGLPPGDEYALTVTLYDVRTLQPIGSTVLPGVRWQYPTIKSGLALVAEFGGLGLYALDAAEMVPQGEPIPVTAHWSVQSAPLPALTARWALIDDSGRNAYVLDTPLAPGSDPATWPRDAYVLGKHTLAPPADLAPGTYTLRLAVFDASGSPLGAYDRPIAITGRPRDFTVPPLAVTMNADYGGIIRLYGYTLERQDDTLRLTLAWGALEAPGRDYEVFVHVFNPANEDIPTQHDSMPRENRYPTSRWVKGEVVTDTITLDLSKVPPGTYRIGVGLYDETGRLGERVVLPDEVSR